MTRTHSNPLKHALNNTACAFFLMLINDVMDLRSVQNTGAGRFLNFLYYWGPVLFWLAMIFTASADQQSYQHSSRLFEPLLRWLFPHLSPLTVATLHHLFRKTCHLTEYAILGWLFWRAIRRPVKNDPRPWHWAEAGLALAGVFAYAATDEFHQIYVPNRTPLISDVLIDTTGGVAGLLLLWLWHGGVAPLRFWLRSKASKPG